MSLVNSASFVPNENVPKTHQRKEFASCRGELSGQSTKPADLARKFAFQAYSLALEPCALTEIALPSINTQAYRMAAARFFRFCKRDADIAADTTPPKGN